MSAQVISRLFIDPPLRGATHFGFDRKEILGLAGLSTDALDNCKAGLDAQSYSQLMIAIWKHCNDECMGFAPTPVRFGTFAMMAKAVISCTSLDHALHRAQRFYSLVAGAPGIRIEKSEHLARIVIEHNPSFDPDRFLSESLLAVWHRFSSWLVGQGIPLLSVSCAYPKPQHAALYQTVFATPINFDADATALIVPARVLDLAIIQTPASLRAFLQHSPADFLARPNPHQSMTGRVRKLLQQSQPNNLPSLNQAADTLGTSAATLRRRLATEQISYQQLKDAFRQQEASRLLAQSDTCIRDIADYLGFTESSAFQRAYRKWTGVTPGSYRANQRKASQ
ncbi:MAG: AraC family transcriptional regulator [Thalassolituus sp.]|jgi:AraC-like DNA-binding protein|uniref:Transcriptional regulator, AraC family n=1 Tax=hydrothermal vent metagenome TaxID=652676 RepID=A0A160TD38_9ZZZZ|nr:AraC family transcriptional regulator [Thalassolituus oleivorans]AHK15619.1 AraC family transcriptional regulator [Thalassolituus oleivorans R6-15]PCI49155.1 MAG: AraC family transcriptional regulator [Oceanospirillales bacterium]